MMHETDRPADVDETGESFLRRWSRRKHAVARDALIEPAPAAVAPSPDPAAAPSLDAAGPTRAGTPASAAPPPLPPVESLTFESDFRAFLEPHVGEDLKRQALRKLLHDPRFNVMDGLDVYIDDYSVPSPLAPELAASLAQARYVFDPPATRVNAAGHVEDVPADSQRSEAEEGNAPNPATLPADADTPSHERRGASPDEGPGTSTDPLLPGRGGTRSSADGVVEAQADPDAPAEAPGMPCTAAAPPACREPGAGSAPR